MNVVLIGVKSAGKTTAGKYLAQQRNCDFYDSDAVALQMFADEKENHCRKTLNLGHTLGHAIEKHCQYQISHGQAVQLGIELESFIAVKRGLLPKSQFNRIQQRLHRLIQQRMCFDSHAIRHIIQLTQQDKKNQQQQIHCCLLSNIGQVYCDNGNYTTAVTQEEIQNALQWFTQRELTTC